MKNPEIRRRITADYAARKKERTLVFSDNYFKELNDLCVNEIYKQAVDLTNLLEDVYEVDPVVPLQGKNVSGLHIWYNLQVLTREENRRKSNKHTP